MRKGTTAIRNIELLKWCKEYDVKPYWNLLYGFPGETADDYAETTAFLPAIWHLDPPTGCGPIRMDRFSPYHTDPEGFGLADVRPMASFTYLYPFERRTLSDKPTTSISTTPTDVRGRYMRERPSTSLMRGCPPPRAAHWK